MTRRSSPGRPDARPYALITIGGALTATALTGYAHLASAPGMNATAQTISDYAVSNRGGPMEAAMFVLGTASLALPLGLRAARARVGRLVTLLLVGWSLGLMIAAVVPTDPIGAALTTTGYVHRYVSVTAFVCLPVAALLAARRLSPDPRWRDGLWPVRALAVSSVAGLLVLYYVAFPGERVLMGLVQRALVATEVLLLALLAIRLYQMAGRIVIPAADRLTRAPAVMNRGAR